MYVAGLPKPAIITQAKAIGMSKFFSLFDFMTSDIIYTTTPLYHSAAGGLGLMNTLDQGNIIFHLFTSLFICLLVFSFIY